MQESFKKIFSFKGRIGTAEYGFTIVVAVIAITIIYALMQSTTTWFAIFFLIAIWLLIAQGTKRCQDMNCNGGWQFCPFFVFGMLLIKGNKKTNKYGIPVKKTTNKKCITDKETLLKSNQIKDSDWKL